MALCLNRGAACRGDSGTRLVCLPKARISELRSFSRFTAVSSGNIFGAAAGDKIFIPGFDDFSFIFDLFYVCLD